MALQKEPNFSRTYNFQVIIPELPIVSEMAQDFLIPAISLNPADVYNRHQDYALPGEKMTFGEIDIGFIVDDNLDAYVEIYNWMRVISAAYQQPVEERIGLHCDTTLILLDNNKNPTRNIKFLDCWPTSIGAASFDLIGPATVKSILTMKFTAIEIDPLDNDTSGFNSWQYKTDPA